MDTLQFQIYKQVTSNNATSMQWVWEDAYSEFGVMMGDGFLDALLVSSPLKPFVTNKSRLIDGERVVVTNVRKDSRSLTLSFTINGISQSDFKTKKAAFYDYLYTGDVRIRFAPPASGQPDTRPTAEEFRFTYNGESVAYGEDLTHTSCKVSIKFKEPNPANRSSL